jgi:hypothetical protein
MHLMLYLDVTGDNEIRECALPGCANLFRAGPYTTTLYCSERCAGIVSSRKHLKR